MQRNPGYRAAWAARLPPPRFGDADIPVRSQTKAGPPAEADRALLAWEDPEVEVWRLSYWPGVPMLTVVRVGLSVIRRKPSTTDMVNSPFGDGSNLAFWRAKLG